MGLNHLSSRRALLTSFLSCFSSHFSNLFLLFASLYTLSEGDRLLKEGLLAPPMSQTISDMHSESELPKVFRDVKLGDLVSILSIRSYTFTGVSLGTGHIVSKILMEEHYHADLLVNPYPCV